VFHRAVVMEGSPAKALAGGDPVLLPPSCPGSAGGISAATASRSSPQQTLPGDDRAVAARGSSGDGSPAKALAGWDPVLLPPSFPGYAGCEVLAAGSGSSPPTSPVLHRAVVMDGPPAQALAGEDPVLIPPSSPGSAGGVSPATASRSSPQQTLPGDDRAVAARGSSGSGSLAKALVSARCVRIVLVPCTYF
jgi:hypothetical protein